MQSGFISRAGSSYDLKDKFIIYINDLINNGIIYKTESSDLLIPELIQRINESINLGIYTEFNVFNSEIDAKSFIADLFSKAIKNVKIIKLSSFRLKKCKNYRYIFFNRKFK